MISVLTSAGVLSYLVNRGGFASSTKNAEVNSAQENSVNERS
jgi:hypothetical protein